MRYTYIAAWTVVGGVSLPSDLPTVELFRSDQSCFVLTREPDVYLSTADRGFAIGSSMLHGFLGRTGEGNISDSLNTVIAKLRADRQKKVGNHAVLVYEASGDIDATIPEISKEHDDFMVTFDAVDKDSIKKRHHADIRAMKLALSLEGDTAPKFTTLVGDVYLTTESSKVVYSITFSMSAEVSTSSGLSEEKVLRISSRYLGLRKDRDLEQVQRLYAQMTDSRSDQLKAFLSGWAALEILITKTFRDYENRFLSPLTEAGQLSLRERFLQRLKSVMKDKYRLSDKFLIVASMLFPDPADTSVEDDFEKFSKLKGLRDSIFHGEEFEEKGIPVVELKTLLRKYILAHSIKQQQVVSDVKE